MIVVEELMASLAVRRPVFCSEADFQHELAYEIRKQDPTLNVRLEWPLAAPARGAIDLIVIGETRFALELKYLSKSFSTTIDGEAVTLKQHGAHDQRRYDVCKDVARMEAYAEATGYGAGVLVLTNDPSYWQDRARADTIDAAFNLSHLRELTGNLAWHELAKPGTTKNREVALEIKGRYALAWQDYNMIDGRAGRFRYLWIPISLPTDVEAA
jgi:hypothetical protein